MEYILLLDKINKVHPENEIGVRWKNGRARMEWWNSGRLGRK